LRYLGFDIPPKFIVGYGMDYAQRYRNLPYIATLEQGWARLWKGGAHE